MKRNPKIAPCDYCEELGTVDKDGNPGGSIPCPECYSAPRFVSDAERAEWIDNGAWAIDERLDRCITTITALLEGIEEYPVSATSPKILKEALEEWRDGLQALAAQIRSGK